MWKKILATIGAILMTLSREDGRELGHPLELHVVDKFGSKKWKP